MAWIFYAMIALFFGYLLFDAFGKPVGRSKPSSQNSKRRVGSANRGNNSKETVSSDYDTFDYASTSDLDQGFKLDDKLVAPGADRALIEAGLRDIMDADDGFQLDGFLVGAKRTLELMLEAYQARDREQLQILLKPDLYDAFNDATTAAEEADDNSKLELIGLGDPRLVDANMEDTTAVVVITTRLEQLVSKRDQDGGEVEGLGETVMETSEYTFVRDVNSNAPNWYLRSIEEA